MARDRNGLTCGAIKVLTVSSLCVCFTVITLLWMAVLCPAIQSSGHKLT
ncbi:unnamed protein product, partial [Staurois parvus]